MTNVQNEPGEFGLSEGEPRPPATQVPTPPGDASPAGAVQQPPPLGAVSAASPADAVQQPPPLGAVSAASPAGGPKTAWGKAKSSLNAIKHGLCADSAKNAIIEGEDPAELEAMHEEFLADEKPQTATERLLVERIVMAGWKLRRASRYEAQVLQAKLATVRRQRVHNTKWGKDADDEAELDVPRAIDLMLAGRAHAQMVRHESAISRELYKAIGELRKVQKDKEKRTRNMPASRHGTQAEQSDTVASPPDARTGVVRSATPPRDDSTDERATWVRVAEPPSPFASRGTRRRR